MAFTPNAIRWYREVVRGELPADPDNFLLPSVTEFSLTGEINTEQVDFVGTPRSMPQQSFDGVPTYSGNVNQVITPKVMPLLLWHGIGAALTSDPAAGDWTADTAVTAGEIVRAAGGTWYLYCRTPGTTGSDEPDLSGASEYDLIDDNGVIWVARQVMTTYSGQIDDCLDTFGIEITSVGDSCSGGAGDDFKERFGGCYVNSLSFGLAGEDTNLTSEIAVEGSVGDDNASNPSYVDQPGMDYELSGPFWAPCDVTVLVDGAPVANTTEARLTLENGVSQDLTVNCDMPNVVQLGKPNITGTLNLLLDKAIYAKIVNRDYFQLTFVYDNNKGDTMIIDVPRARYDRTGPTYETGRFVTLEATYTAEGSASQSALTYKCTTSIVYGA